MNEKTDIKLPNEELLACFTDVEQEYYSKLDLNRPIDFIGCYYYGIDVQKVHARFKDGCKFVGDPSLNLMVTNILMKSERASDIGRHIQSLHTDSNGEDMLTSWVDIDDLLSILDGFNWGTTIELLATLKDWKKQGVQEIYFSWYEKVDSVVVPTNFFDLDKPNPNIKSGKSILNDLQDDSVIEKDSLEKEALLLLRKGLLLIRSMATSKEISCTNLELIKNIADACHNVPYYYQIQDFKNLKYEVMMMEKVINGGNDDNS